MKKYNTLITDCSNELSELTVKVLASNGEHHIFAGIEDINGKNYEKVQKLKEWTQKEALPVTIVELDITDQNSINKTVKGIIDKYKKIDILINNSGILSIGALETLSIDQVEKLFSINTFGPLRVSNTVIPYMRQKQFGLIINIANTIGRLFMPFSGAYAASKKAMESLTFTYSYELAKFGIESVIIEPGEHLTGIKQNMLIPENQDALSHYSSLLNLQKKVFSKKAIDIANENNNDPQEVIDTIEYVISLPLGLRPFRTIVGEIESEGVEEQNKVITELQDVFLNNISENIGSN